MWPKFAAYVLSFIMLGVFWSYHHIMFQYINRVEKRIIWINILILMFVALILFSTAMIGEYQESSLTAVLFYGTNLFILVLGSNILWWYIVKNKHLLNKDISPREIMQFKVNGAMPAILLLAIGLSFINPYIGIGIYILLVLWIIIGQLASKIYHPDGEKI